MKIDSVIVIDVTTREEELEELLNPGGTLNRAVYDALMKIRNATTEEESEEHYTELDNAINTYMQFAIEWDRIQRRKYDGVV